MAADAGRRGGGWPVTFRTVISRSRMAKLYDVSLPIESGGVVYPGNAPIEIAPIKTVAAGASSTISKICFGSHTATHVDPPSHFYAEGRSVDELSLDVLIGPALLVRLPDDVMAINADHARAATRSGHTRILFATRNSTFNRERDFHPDFTYVAPDAAAILVRQGVKLVGVDYLSIEQYHSGHGNTHKTLLGAGVVIIEGLQLSDPPAGEYELICLPLRLKGLDGAPARCVLRSH
jgi:arylformamidase